MYAYPHSKHYIYTQMMATRELNHDDAYTLELVSRMFCEEEPDTDVVSLGYCM